MLFTVMFMIFLVQASNSLRKYKVCFLVFLKKRYKVVMDLVRPHFDKNHHVTMDNWFTSPKLVKDLLDRGTLSTGSVIATRKGMPASFKTARLPKGTVIAKSKGQLLAVLFSGFGVCGFLKTNIYMHMHSTCSLFRLPDLNNCLAIHIAQQQHNTV